MVDVHAPTSRVRAAERAVRDLRPDFAIIRERGAYRVSSVAVPYEMGTFLKPAYRKDRRRSSPAR